MSALAGLALVAVPVAGPTARAAGPAAPPYTDVSGSPDLAAIEFLTVQGVLNGYPDGTFRPENTITRAEFTAAVVRLLGPKAQESAQALSTTAPTFSDGQSIPTWAWGYVNYAQGLGLITGYPDGTFRADNSITMVEAAAILVRAIGDAKAVPAGTWPSNYTIAAYNLNLTQNVTFYASLPASRGDVAQMLYDAAVLAPTLQTGYASGLPTGAPLYEGGGGFAQSAWSGQVAGASSTQIVLQNAQGQTILSAPVAASYYLSGATAISALTGLSALVAENPQGQVAFVQVQAGGQTKASTLASNSVATPAGYLRLHDFLVQNENGGGFALLLGDGSLQPLVSATSGTGTNYYLNTPSTGASADANALVPGPTSFHDGDAVTVTENGSGQAVDVYATDNTYTLGLVQSVNTASNTLTFSTGAADNTQVTVTVQPWTEVTLGGSAAALSALQKDDVVTVQVVGGGNNGDANASAIAAVRQTVSGTITSVTTETSAGTTTVQLGLTEQNGQTTVVTEDPSFDAAGANLAVGRYATLVLDGSGQARLAEAAQAQQTVVLVKGVQTTTTATTAGQQTVQQIVADSAGQTVTYNLQAGAPAPAQPPANGYLAVVSVQPGSSPPTVAAVAPLTQVSPPAGAAEFKVYSDDGSTIILQAYAASGQAVGNPLAVLSSTGAVVYSGTTYESFGALPAGTVVTLWASPTTGTYLGVRQ